jgi:hypothetical protein
MYLEPDVHPVDEVEDGEVLLGECRHGASRHAFTQLLFPHNTTERQVTFLGIRTRMAAL